MNTELVNLINEIKTLRNFFYDYHCHPIFSLYFKLLISNYKDYILRRFRNNRNNALAYYSPELNNREIKNKLKKINKVVKDKIIECMFKYHNNNFIKFSVMTGGLGIRNAAGIAIYMYYNYLIHFLNIGPVLFYGHIKGKDSKDIINITDFDLSRLETLERCDEKELMKFLTQAKMILKDLIKLNEDIITLVKTTFDTQATIVSI